MDEPLFSMQCLYDSDTFVLIHMRYLHGGQHVDSFELVDKSTDRSFHMHGGFAEVLDKHLRKWQQNPPHVDQVERLLSRYAQLATNPLLCH